MVRVLIFLIAVGIVAIGAAWLADRPGEISVVWLGWRIETSLMVATIALIVVIVVSVTAWSLLRAIVRTPERLSLLRRARRNARGQIAISRGLIAIGSGDARTARRFADEAKRLVPYEPLSLLLSAQTAQLTGDRAAAEETFRTMVGRDDTRLLGLHGLFVEARRRGDVAAARLAAEEAAQASPAPAWAGHAALEFRCAAGDWNGALDRLDGNLKAGLIDKAHHRRQRAVLLTAQALAAEPVDRDRCIRLAREAVKLAPTLVPAAALAGRLAAESGELRNGARIIETAWRVNPHPELADAYLHLRYGDSPRDRLSRAQKLAQKAPEHIESALALARAALDAQEFGRARAALAPFIAAPTQRVAMLVAEIEQTEHGDAGRAREWTARAVRAARDPAWTADGIVSDHWMPVSPVTGRLDAFEWRVPLAELAGPKVIDESGLSAAGEPRPLPVERVTPAVAATKDEAVSDVAAAPTGGAVAAHEPRPGSATPAAKAPPTGGESVIPLVHAPDDPGPDAEPERDPEAEPDSTWRRLRQPFR